MELALLLSLPCCSGPCGSFPSQDSHVLAGEMMGLWNYFLWEHVCCVCRLFSDTGKLLIKVFSQLYMPAFTFRSLWVITETYS